MYIHTKKLLLNIIKDKLALTFINKKKKTAYSLVQRTLIVFVA